MCSFTQMKDVVLLSYWAQITTVFSNWMILRTFIPVWYKWRKLHYLFPEFYARYVCHILRRTTKTHTQTTKNLEASNRQHVSHKNLQTNTRYKEIWEHRFAFHTDSQHKLLSSRVKLYVKNGGTAMGYFTIFVNTEELKMEVTIKILNYFFVASIVVYEFIPALSLPKVNVCFLITYR